MGVGGSAAVPTNGSYRTRDRIKQYNFRGHIGVPRGPFPVKSGTKKSGSDAWSPKWVRILTLASLARRSRPASVPKDLFLYVNPGW